MPVSLRDVLDLEVLKSTRVRAAKEALTERPVEWVSVIEIPVENFVRERELVLSTAIGCGHDEELLLSFVAEIEASRASALALAVGRYVHEIPGKVIAYCQAHRFPLIELPWEVRFADIIRAVSDLTLRKQYEVAETFQKELSRLLLQRAGPEEICERVSQLIGAPVAVADTGGRVRAASRALRAKVPSLEAALASRDLEAEQDFWLDLEGLRCLCRSIAFSGRRYGHVIVGLAAAEPDLPAEYAHALNQVAIAMGMWFLQERVVLETELRLREDFVWNLAQGSTGLWEETLSKGALLGFDLNRPFICLVGQLEAETGVSVGAQDHPQAHEGEALVYWQLREIARFSPQQVLVTHQQGRFVVFLEVPSRSKLVWRQTVQGFLDALAARLEQAQPGSVLSWGISRYHGEGPAFAQAYRDARIALQVGRTRRGLGCRMEYQDTGIYRALLRLAEDAEVGEIVLSVMTPLVDYSGQRGLDLVSTLTAYLRHQGNISQTARALGLHRQSLIYRLEKIETLTGRSLLDPEDRFLLQLCAELWQLGNVYTENPPRTDGSF
jgi:purine catabolism regulator